MSTLPWTPWHKLVRLRDDLRSGELSLSIFAADLYDVAMQKGQRPVYEDPAQFFALTYPTYNLRELARDVVLRLAGRNDKAVRQLELTYGGGKTHALITLFHLVNDPARLPDLPAVQEFIQHIGLTPAATRVAVLPFDKLDVEKGAVLATFLHSQPIGQKALTRELLLLLGHSRPDRIELEKGLRRWADVSWFLDESAAQETETLAERRSPLGDGAKGLPRSWRLGSRPNLTQMHHDACRAPTAPSGRFGVNGPMTWL
jgi:hypothetical protein